MRWMRKLAAEEPSPATLSPDRRITASGLRPVSVPMALPMSWGPFTSTTITFNPPAAAVRAERAALLPFASQTTATVPT